MDDIFRGDLVRLVIQLDRPSNNPVITAKGLLPGVVAENSQLRSILCFGGEGLTKEWLDSQDGEETRCDLVSLDP